MSDFSRLIASSVGECSLEPLAHAEPVEHATPAMSKAIANACRSRPGKAMLAVLGIRLARAPMTVADGISDAILCSNRSRNSRIRSARAWTSACQHSSATHRPIANATVSVPGRRSACWCPPKSEGCKRMPCLMVKLLLLSC